MPVPRIVLVLAALASVSAGASAQSTPKVVDATLRNRFGFLGPKVHKVGNGMEFLRIADLDGDGSTEIVVNHAERGRLTILRRQEPDAIDAEYTDTDGAIYGFELADVDGDGVLDFVLLSRQGRLVTKLRGKAPKPRPEIELGVIASDDALRLGDLNGDGSIDAVALLRDGVRVVTDLRGEPQLAPTIPLTYERAMSFLLTDVDGDRRLDVVVLTTKPEMPLHVAFGDGAGGFGPWVLFRTPEMRRVFPGIGTTDGQPTLLAIQDQRNRVVEYVVRRTDASVANAASVVAPQLTSTHEVKRGAFPFVQGDIDGDGVDDIVLAHPERAELIYLFERDGRFDMRAVPTLAGISGLAIGDLDGDGRLDLVIASSEEQTVAWRSGTAELDAFPQRLPTPESPLAVAVDDAGRVLFLTKDSKRTGKLYRVTPGAAAAEDLGEIGRLSGDPQRLLFADVDAAPGGELVCVVPGEGLRVIRIEDGKAKALEGGASAGFTKKVEDGALSIVAGAVPGQQALMVVRERFARMFRLDAAGEVVIERQVNAPSDAGEIALGTVFRDGGRMFVDRKANKLYIERDGSAPTAFDLPTFGVTHLIEHADTAVLIGRSGVVRVPFGATWRLEPIRDHEPPTDDTNYWRGIAADFDGDGQRDIALLDEDINGVHVLTKTAEGLGRALGFPVFELPEKGGTVWEPREIAAGDWDGDGRNDLILISHDRILIYRQEP